uniref:Uncharacterized protein n=1 Tax=Cucumis melo TaxID=3656 RepID=A0A9I9E1X0_CUCME
MKAEAEIPRTALRSSKRRKALNEATLMESTSFRALIYLEYLNR